MNVDTGAFENLAAQIAELAEQIRDLRAEKFSAEMFFAAGVEHGRERMLGKAARTSGAATPARTAGPRPAHLRAVKP